MKALLLIASWLFCTSILHTTPLTTTGISEETMPIDTSVSRDFTIYEHMECQLLKEWHYKGEDVLFLEGYDNNDMEYHVRLVDKSQLEKDSVLFDHIHQTCFLYDDFSKDDYRSYTPEEYFNVSEIDTLGDVKIKNEIIENREYHLNAEKELLEEPFIDLMREVVIGDEIFTTRENLSLKNLYLITGQDSRDGKCYAYLMRSFYVMEEDLITDIVFDARTVVNNTRAVAIKDMGFGDAFTIDDLYDYVDAYNLEQGIDAPVQRLAGLHSINNPFIR